MATINFKVAIITLMIMATLKISLKISIPIMDMYCVICMPSSVYNYGLVYQARWPRG